MIVNKDKAAKTLARSHAKVEESIVKIIRLYTKDRKKEKDVTEPIKLLEVNPDTVSAGIMPVLFGSSADIPFSCVVIEVTEDEYKEIEKNPSQLPEDWTIGDILLDKEKVA